MTYYLGVDIGTTSCKAVAFSATGAVLSTASVGYDMQHPQPNWTELDPDEILAAAIGAINELLQNMKGVSPVFVSFSAAMHSLMAIDANGILLSKCIIWADNRANLIADELRGTHIGWVFYQKSGVPIHAMSPFCKLLWLQQNQPDLFTTADKFIGIKEYIFFKLFGEFLVDTSVASATGLLNINTLQWDDDICNYVGISKTMLSRVVSTKHIMHYKGKIAALALPSNIPFVIGASDGALSNLGTGAVGENAMALTIGTSGAARMVVNTPEIDANMRTFCYHLKDNSYVAGGANNNGAVVLQWLKETLLQTNDAYETLFELAATVEAGSDALILLPYILGERAPIWNSNAKGVFFGLNVQHTKAHLIRASMEGVIYSMYSIAKILAEKRTVTELHASGGFAKSSLWLQILADVANTKVLVSGAVESAALGAVIIGAEALGISTNFTHRVLSVHEPNPANHEVYKKSFAQFERLYGLLKAEMMG